MKAPKKFKYSPNGFIVIQVAKDEEMSEAAIKAAIDLEIINKAKVPAANKAKAPSANKAKAAGPQPTTSNDEASND
jgi:hypothetical protein